MLRNSEHAWGAVAKLLHWSMAVLIITQIVLGILAVEWRLSPAKLNLFVWHKSLGILLLVLVAVRLLWRLANPRPPSPPTMPRWQILASRANHAILYVCMVALPLTGWIINSASNVPFRIFWLIPLPHLTSPDKVLADTMKLVHGGLVVVFLVVLAVHVVAAFYHHFRVGDNVLSRMLPGRRSGK